MNYGIPKKMIRHQIMADLWEKLMFANELEISHYWELVKNQLWKNTIHTKATTIYYATITPMVSFKKENGKLTHFVLNEKYKEFSPELFKLELNKDYNVKTIHYRLHQIYPDFIGIESFTNWIHADYTDTFMITIDKIRRLK